LRDRLQSHANSPQGGHDFAVIDGIEPAESVLVIAEDRVKEAAACIFEHPAEPFPLVKFVSGNPQVFVALDDLVALLLGVGFHLGALPINAIFLAIGRHAVVSDGAGATQRARGHDGFLSEKAPDAAATRFSGQITATPDKGV
jgi:hypothetical protein